jgi:hypothetical protein
MAAFFYLNFLTAFCSKVNLGKENHLPDGISKA